eukprot:TRINITY_DN11616_c0_g2_i4.p1 TRINITY_DN11616_c0_g2~~TRINITY_DN11616_c0_g2_i4.p1  ORF type:complete len:107 (+),score=0.90 TRINITY_DN11616_c0_g2_i4:74-394(+)
MCIRDSPKTCSVRLKRRLISDSAGSDYFLCLLNITLPSDSFSSLESWSDSGLSLFPDFASSSLMTTMLSPLLASISLLSEHTSSELGSALFCPAHCGYSSVLFLCR